MLDLNVDSVFISLVSLVKPFQSVIDEGTVQTYISVLVEHQVEIKLSLKQQ